MLLNIKTQNFMICSNYLLWKPKKPSSGGSHMYDESSIKILKQSMLPFLRNRVHQFIKCSFEKNMFKNSGV